MSEQGKRTVQEIQLAISEVQQSIWNLQKAKTNIVTAIGGSDLADVYCINLEVMIEDLEDDLIALHEELV